MHSRLVWLLPLALAACSGPGPGVGDDDDDDVAPGVDAGAPDAPMLAPCEMPAFTAGVSTLAGCGEAASQDGPRSEARFNNPVNVVEGPTGLLYVADFDNGAIRVVETDGTVSTLVRQTGFSRPFGMTIVGPTLYVSTDNNPEGMHGPMTGTIWAIDIETGDATVVVHDIGRPRGLAALPDGRLAVTDYQHFTVSLLTPSTGAITPLAGKLDAAGSNNGKGETARFMAPIGVGVLPDGSLAVADMTGNAIRNVQLDGTVTTIVACTTPEGLTVGPDGAIYVSDANDHTIRVVHGTAIETFAGTGEAGWRDSDDPLTAQLYGIEGLSVSRDGLRLWVADGTHGESDPYNRLRFVDLF